MPNRAGLGPGGTCAGTHRWAIRPTERTTATVTLDLSQLRGGDPAATEATEGPPWRCTLTLSAVARDLERLAGVLADPITPVRRAALVGHVGFLADHAARNDHAAPSGRSVALSRLRHESRLWSRDPRRRAELRASAETAAALFDTLRGSVPTGPDPTDRGRESRPSMRLRELPVRRPAALAFDYFWLLDDLPPDLARQVVTEFSGPARWVMRNVLSGAYNRRAFLMWIGGGSGPAL